MKPIDEVDIRELRKFSREIGITNKGKKPEELVGEIINKVKTFSEEDIEGLSEEFIDFFNENLADEER